MQDSWSFSKEDSKVTSVRSDLWDAMTPLRSALNYLSTFDASILGHNFEEQPPAS